VCVFLDEALFAGNKEHEGVLKALITEPTLRAEGKFRDPITAPNRLRLVIASNAEWIVPVGIGDRRFAVFDVASHRKGDFAYFDALKKQMENGGLAAMMHDLMHMDLSGFEVRHIPGTEARSDQITLSLRGPLKWLYSVLQDAAIEGQSWGENGLQVSRDRAYENYAEFGKSDREYRPAICAVWAKEVRAALGVCMADSRPWADEGPRPRYFIFRPLAECRAAFAAHLKTEISWEAAPEPDWLDDILR
jgi:hypothetical protein